MKPFEYASPPTIDEVITLLGQDRDGATMPLAGGTDLLPLMKADVAPIPWRAGVAEQELIGADASPELFARAAETALVGAEVLDHNAYKLPLVKTLIRRALKRLAEDAIAGT